MTKTITLYADRGALTDTVVPEHELRPAGSGIRAYVALGILALGGLVGGAGYWAVSAKLDGAVIAPASFVVRVEPQDSPAS